jgi:hypothetical protein
VIDNDRSEEMDFSDEEDEAEPDEPDTLALLDEPAAALLGTALRANCTLRLLYLSGVGFFNNDVNAAAALLRALTAHRSLTTLCIAYVRDAMDAATRRSAGAALGALVAANAPALASLLVANCGLGDAGLGPLADALPHNTHLRRLCADENDLTDAFMQSRLPAVRANCSLQELTLEQEDTSDAAREAMGVVRRRREGGATTSA